MVTRAQPAVMMGNWMLVIGLAERRFARILRVDTNSP
jgi:hypothetical protein